MASTSELQDRLKVKLAEYLREGKHGGGEGWSAGNRRNKSLWKGNKRKERLTGGFEVRGCAKKHKSPGQRGSERQ